MYETNDTLDAEGVVASKIASAWNCDFQKLPIRYHLDFVLTRRKVAMAFCEVKSRSYTMDDIGKMGGYLLSVGKWTAAKSMSDACGIPFILVVKTVDGIWHASFQQSFKPDGISVMGRADRGDWQDVEPCIILNTNKFKRLSHEQ